MATFVLFTGATLLDRLDQKKRAAKRDPLILD
jgi:hypothetical protein